MHAPFDHVAGQYDDTFTNTLVGRAQRDVVWKYLNKHLPNQPLRILELNCGTGEDAIWLAKKGHHVVATDISANMLEAARKKALRENLQITFRQWDLTQPSPMPEEQFDVIFSNFGGLNCLDNISLENVLKQLHTLLIPGGVCISVIMGRFCMMESLYMFLSGRWRLMRRRDQPGAVSVQLQSGEAVDTYYYAPEDILHMCMPHFVHVRTAPVGVTIPPGYMESQTGWKIRVNRMLIKLDLLFQQALFARWSDHYILELRKIDGSI